MIAIVVPEPAPWLAPLAEAARALGDVTVFAPWAMPPAGRWLPARLRTALARRAPPFPGARSVHGWPLLDLALGAWTRGRADRLLVARFARRRLAGRLAARWLPADARLVIAPSLAARRVFAAAGARGAACALVEDLPGLRGLHLDLDRAAARQPADAFLRRYRAPAALVAEQEAERALAGLLLVRSLHARDERRAAGLPPERVAPLPGPSAPEVRPRAQRRGGGPVLLLAGLATARSGLAQALDAAARIPAAILLVRAGEGAPPDLLRRPGVRAATREERERLDGVDLVLAPALCESHPPEVLRAAGAGVPVVGTRRAAGLVDLDRAGRAVEPGDADAVWRAACELLAAGAPPAPPAAAPGWPPVAERLRALLSSTAAATTAPRSSLHLRGSP